MAYVYLGKKPYKFTNKEDGVVYTGIRMHCIAEVPAPGEGQLTEVFSIGTNKSGFANADSLPFGSIVNPVYNRFGKVDDIIVISRPDEKK